MGCASSNLGAKKATHAPAACDSSAQGEQQQVALPAGAPTRGYCGPAHGASCRSVWDIDTRAFAGENERLAELHSCGMLGTPPDPRFDNITRLMCSIFDVPLALVSLIGDEQLFFKSVAGAGVSCGGSAGGADESMAATSGRDAPREGSFCDALLVPTRHEVLVVEDAASDARFCNIPLVSGRPRIRFYAGVPLVGSGGHRLGALCVIDFKPRSFNAGLINTLLNFAELVVREMERDKSSEQRTQQAQAQAPRPLLRRASCFSEGVALLDVEGGADWPLAFANDAWTAALSAGTDRATRRSSSNPHQAAGQAAAAGAFWHVFHPGGGAREAATAVVEGRQPARLTLTLQLAPAAGCRTLDVVLRPASADQLQTDVLVGIPNHVPPEPDGDAPPSADDGAGVAEGADVGRYWFAVLRRPASPSRSRAAAGSDPGASLAPDSASEASSATARVGHADVHAAPEPARSASPGAGSQSDAMQQAGQAQRGGAPVSTLAWKEGSTTVYSRTTSLVSSASLSRPLHSPNSVLRGGAVAGPGTPPAMWRPLRRHGQLAPDKLRGMTLGPLLGSGGYGRVYRGMWNGVMVAVKVLETYAPLGDEPDEVEDPLMEAVLSRQLRHPHIVQTFDYATRSETVVTPEGSMELRSVWVLQKYCNRGTLYDGLDRAWLRLGRRHGAPPDAQAVLATAVEVASALTYLHSEGIIHGDLTGTNVLLDFSSRDDRCFCAMVGDFGLARLAAFRPVPECEGGGLVTSTHGTVTHQPPEVLANGLLTPAADVWALGVLLYEMWTGCRAFLGQRAPVIMEQVKGGGARFELPSNCLPAYKTLCDSCLSRDFRHRPSARSVLKQLLAMQGVA